MQEPDRGDSEPRGGRVDNDAAMGTTVALFVGTAISAASLAVGCRRSPPGHLRTMGGCRDSMRCAAGLHTSAGNAEPGYAVVPAGYGHRNAGQIACQHPATTCRALGAGLDDRDDSLGADRGRDALLAVWPTLQRTPAASWPAAAGSGHALARCGRARIAKRSSRAAGQIADAFCAELDV